jgi:hypothetical protein
MCPVRVGVYHLHGFRGCAAASSKCLPDRDARCKSQVFGILPTSSGAEHENQVVPVNSGSCTLKDAVNEALRDWVTNLATTHYLVGSVIGPHPFPTLVRDFQRVIGREIKSQLQELTGKLPDVLVACVGGGSNAIGTFYDFIQEKNVRLIGVEAGGEGTDAVIKYRLFSILCVRT